ncbi:MAG: hypothetical protein M1820_001040 [Bogoriella megaspora]|nr:MAG: hypothetical protein M1820_001040 [Bogoriella megaspora]
MRNLESDVLRPKDPSLVDDNDWPEFLLTNAEVHDTKSWEHVNLLHADEHAPVTVTGKLEGLDRSQAHLLLKSSYQRSISLEISDVNSYSYGIYDDGDVDIWATGLAGYYKIRPSRAYKPIYQDMAEAVKVLYFLVDMHSGPSGRMKTGKNSPSPEKIFREYVEETVNCADARDAAKQIYKHRHFLFMSMLRGKEGINWENTAFFRHMAERYPAGLEAARPQNRRLKRKRDARVKEDSMELERASEDAEMQDVPRVFDGPTSIISPRRRGRPPKNREVLHQSSTPLQQTTNVKHDSEDSEDNAAMYDRRRAQKGKGKGKATSILRPTTVKNFPTEVLDEDDGDSPVPVGKRKNIEILERQPPKRALRSQPQPNFDEDEAIDMPSDDDVDMVDADDAAFGSNPKITLPLHWKNGPIPEGGTSKRPFAIATEELPSSIPQSPGDVWTCTYDGCIRKVYGASKEPGKGLVEEHLKTHTAESEERVDLVRREGEMLAGLPVNNLIKRIREMAASKQLGPVPAAANSSSSGRLRAA